MRLGLNPMPADARNLQNILFWVAAGLMTVFKLVLVSDLSVTINYSPHDDSLYVERAFALLSGQGFGPYDSRVLVKYPGITLWLAGTRLTGLPFLLSVNLVYMAAAWYMLFALLRCGTVRWLVLLSFGFLLFNPITFGVEWTRVIREPLSMGLFVALTASMLHIAAARAVEQRFWGHLLLFSLVFAFSLFLREDDRLLWGLLILFFAALIFQAWQRAGSWSRISAAPLIAVLLMPAGTALVYDMALRQFVQHHYGLPILHEFSEGEYPKFLAAVRSVDSAKDNRMVMVPQDTLRRLRETIPRLAPVIDLLPPPGPGTHSCRLHGVCSEWANGWMPFWIRDAAFRAGLTPSLPAAQDYFREARLDIERACQSGRLKCTPRGSGLVPPMELRWARAYVAEGWRLAGMALRPAPNVSEALQLVYDVPVDLGRKFQTVTMTDRFDTEVQTNFAHRVMLPVFVSPLASLREAMVVPYQVGAVILLLALIPAFAWRLWVFDRYPLSPLSVVAMVVGLYLAARFVILSYVAVFMGAFDPRMMFSTYTVAVLLALPFIHDLSGRYRGAGSNA